MALTRTRRPLIVCKDCGKTREHGGLGFCNTCYDRHYRRENPEKNLAATNKYREEHPEKVRENARKRYAENPEKHREATRKWRAENPERVREYALQREYGISIAEYDELLEAQGNTCAICGKTPEENGKRLCVDHDHETDVVRGLLCRQCNLVIGNAHDDPRILARGIEYLLRGDANESN